MKQKQSLPWRVLTKQKNLECSEDSVICRFELAPPKRPGPEPGALDLSAIHPLHSVAQRCKMRSGGRKIYDTYKGINISALRRAYNLMIMKTNSAWSRDHTIRPVRIQTVRMQGDDNKCIVTITAVCRDYSWCIIRNSSCWFRLLEKTLHGRELFASDTNFLKT